MQKLRDFKTVLAAIHLLFKIVINLENIRKFSGLRLAKLFDYKTVKCEVINVEFLIRDLPLSNYATMVKLKCLKLLYWSKGMWRIDSNLKHLTREIRYNCSSIFSWNFIVLHTLNFLSPMFSGINNNNFSFFGFSNLSFFVFVFTTLKKKIFIFKYF